MPMSAVGTTKPIGGARGYSRRTQYATGMLYVAFRNWTGIVPSSVNSSCVRPSLKAEKHRQRELHITC